MTMKKIEAKDPEAKSTDIVAENIEQLKALFPELITEGPDGVAINVDVLKALVGDKTVTDTDEKYGLNWHGKRQARQMALTPSTGTLRPCPEESVDWDTTQNLMIEGDNLEVLKLLQKSYAGKVKLIYIDPPYNTGKDFVYPDNFQDNIRNYLELTGQVEGGRKISSNTEASGRFHTDWLNMMYPRLRLARNLLKTDGAVFISCDDNEVQNLRALMDDVFGGENFIATVIWQKVYSPKNSARHFSEDHDYLVVYARDAEVWTPRLLPRTEAMESHYSNPDNDPRGPWRADGMSARNYYSKGTYSIITPGGRLIDGPPSGRYWVYSEKKFRELDLDKRIWWGESGNNQPAVKRFKSEVQDGRVPQTLWTYNEVGHTQEAKKELISLVDFPNSDVVFDTPKPTRLIRRILQLATSPGEADKGENEKSFVGVREKSAEYISTPTVANTPWGGQTPEIVLDFFAGTGSTMDAVFRQNAEDGGKRACILVQLPEPLPGGNGGQLKTIADITKERLRRAGMKIQSEQSPPQPSLTGGGSVKQGGLWNSSPQRGEVGRGAIDLGFRVFKLDSSNIRVWEPDRDNLGKTLLDHMEHIKNGRSEADILYELLLKLGLDLCVPMKKRTIARCPSPQPSPQGGEGDFVVHAIGGGVLMVCLADTITSAQVEPLALGIVEWHKALAPAGDTTCVFRDSAFADDVAKTNCTAILNQYGITNVRSL